MEFGITPVVLPGKSHGRRSLVGCSPWGLEELDTTEWLHFYFSLSCIGEGNGNPLQCSCLENPRDGGAWWAAIFGVAQSWTWLKRLSSNSSRDDSWGHKRVGHDWTTELNWTQLRDIGTNAQWLLRMDDRSWLCLMAMALGCTGFLSTSCVPEFLLCSSECTSLGIFLLKC